jgi:hypothetical protein
MEIRRLRSSRLSLSYKISHREASIGRGVLLSEHRLFFGKGGIHESDLEHALSIRYVNLSLLNTSFAAARLVLCLSAILLNLRRLLYLENSILYSAGAERVST